jgi:hypothetical protein
MEPRRFSSATPTNPPSSKPERLNASMNVQPIILPKLMRRVNKIVRSIRRTSYRFVPLSTAISAGEVEVIETLSAGGSFSYPEIVRQGHHICASSDGSRTQPSTVHPIIAFKANDACVIGCCNFILKGRNAVHSDLLLPSRDVSPIEVRGGGRIGENFGSISIRRGISHAHFARAITICDQTHNYAHWMTEILPKLAYLADIEELRGLPIIADRGIGESLIESIFALTGGGGVHLVDAFSTVSVGELYSISSTSYCPHDFRDFFKAVAEGFNYYFSPEALNRLRDRLRTRYAHYRGSRERHVYLKRTALVSWNNRNIVNVDDIEDVIDEFSLETINVAGLTFAQQARAFMPVRTIVAPTGAALANMLFAEEGCRIVVLAADYEGATYDYFYRIAHALGHRISFVTGPQVETTGRIMDRDYAICYKSLRDALERVFRTP